MSIAPLLPLGVAATETLAVGGGVAAAEVAVGGGTVAAGLSGLAIAGLAVLGVVVIGGISYLVYKKFFEEQENQNLVLGQAPPPTSVLVPLSVDISLQEIPLQNAEQLPVIPQFPQLSSDSAISSLTSNQLENAKEFTCPITHQLMVKPFMCRFCSNNFEKNMILYWAGKNKKCPICQKEASKEDFCHNKVLEKCITVFRKKLAKKHKKILQQIFGNGLPSKPTETKSEAGGFFKKENKDEFAEIEIHSTYSQ